MDMCVTELKRETESCCRSLLPPILATIFALGPQNNAKPLCLCTFFQVAINAAPKPSNPYARKLNERRKPWCNRKMCRKYRKGSEERRSDNAVRVLCFREGALRNRIRREVNKGRLKMVVKKFGKCSQTIQSVATSATSTSTSCIA